MNRKFRNPTSAGAAVANAIRIAYAPLYVGNEFMHEATDDVLLGLIVEETGQPAESNSVRLALNCIKHLKQFAKFGEPLEDAVAVPENPVQINPPVASVHEQHDRRERLNLMVRS